VKREREKSKERREERTRTREDVRLRLSCGGALENNRSEIAKRGPSISPAALIRKTV
jgi:hypothetical protein